MISETCGCGASFQAERSDELHLWEDWLARHSCRNRFEFNGSIGSMVERGQNDELDEMRLTGFSRNTEEDQLATSIRAFGGKKKVRFLSSSTATIALSSSSNEP